MAKIGVLLCGAASKGAYEYGFMRAVGDYFGKENIKCVGSASIGMLVAQTYGMDKPQEFVRIWKEIDPKKHGRFFLSYCSSDEIMDKICDIMEDGKSLSFEHYVSVCNFTQSKVEYIPFHTLDKDTLKKYVRGAISVPFFRNGELINGNRILDGGFVDNIPVYPLIEKDLDYIICIYFDNHKYIFENPEFDQKVVKIFDFPNDKRLETITFTVESFDEMAEYGYNYTLKTLKSLFDSNDPETIKKAIKEREENQTCEYKPRLTADVVLHNLNVITRRYAKRMSKWERAD